MTEFTTNENTDDLLWKGEGEEREETVKLDPKALPSLDYILAGKQVFKYVAAIKEASNGANLFGFVEQRDQQVLLSLELLQGHGSIGKLQLQAIELPVETQLVTFLLKYTVSKSQKNILSNRSRGAETTRELILSIFSPNVRQFYYVCSRWHGKYEKDHVI